MIIYNGARRACSDTDPLDLPKVIRNNEGASNFHKILENNLLSL